MTVRKKLKKELSLLKYQRRLLPLLIDCSSVYGDEYYLEDDYKLIDAQIAKVEQLIADIDTCVLNVS